MDGLSVRFLLCILFYWYFCQCASSEQDHPRVVCFGCMCLFWLCIQLIWPSSHFLSRWQTSSGWKYNTRTSLFLGPSWCQATWFSTSCHC